MLSLHKLAQNCSDARRGLAIFGDVLKGTAEKIDGTRNAAGDDFERDYLGVRC